MTIYWAYVSDAFNTQTHLKRRFFTQIMQLGGAALIKFSHSLNSDANFVYILIWYCGDVLGLFHRWNVSPKRGITDFRQLWNIHNGR